MYTVISHFTQKKTKQTIYAVTFKLSLFCYLWPHHRPNRMVVGLLVAVRDLRYDTIRTTVD